MKTTTAMIIGIGASTLCFSALAISLKYGLSNVHGNEAWKSVTRFAPSDFSKNSDFGFRPVGQNETEYELDVRMRDLMDSTTKSDKISTVVLQAYRSYRVNRGEKPFQYLEESDENNMRRVYAERLQFFDRLFTDYKSAFTEKERADIEKEFSGPRGAYLMKASANKAFVGTMTNVAADSFGDRWPKVRSDYAKSMLGWRGLGVISEEEFHSLAAAAVKRDTPERRFLTQHQNIAATDPVEEANVKFLRQRLERLEATIGILLSDPEIKRKFDSRAKLLRIASKQSPTTEGALEDLKMADELYRIFKDYMSDPEGFEERIKNYSPEERSNWNAFMKEMGLRHAK